MASCCAAVLVPLSPVTQAGWNSQPTVYPVQQAGYAQGSSGGANLSDMAQQPRPAAPTYGLLKPAPQYLPQPGATQQVHQW